MKLFHQSLPDDPAARAYYYLGDAENIRLASYEQLIPVNCFPVPNSAERDALDMLKARGFDWLESERPLTFVSFIFSFLKLFLKYFLPVNIYFFFLIYFYFLPPFGSNIGCSHNLGGRYHLFL